MLNILVFALASTASLDTSVTPNDKVPSSAGSSQSGAHRITVSDAVRSFVIDVRVQFGDETLYNGPLHLAPGYVTTYSQILNDTPALICRGAERYPSTDKRALNIRLSQRHNTSEPIHVMVEVVRPAGLAGCAQAGTRTTRTEEWVDLGPNESVAMPGGNEGLGVSLPRR